MVIIICYDVGTTYHTFNGVLALATSTRSNPFPLGSEKVMLLQAIQGDQWRCVDMHPSSWKSAMIKMWGCWYGAITMHIQTRYIGKQKLAGTHPHSCSFALITARSCSARWWPGLSRARNTEHLIQKFSLIRLVISAAQENKTPPPGIKKFNASDFSLSN